MIKFMLFIDGTWLYSNTSRLVEASGEPGFVLDFGRLPRVLAEEDPHAVNTNDEPDRIVPRALPVTFEGGPQVTLPPVSWAVVELELRGAGG